MLTHPQMLVASPVFALSLFLEVEVLDTLLLASGVDVAFGVLVGVFVGCVVGIVVGAVVGVVVGAVVGVTVGVSVGVTVGVSGDDDKLQLRVQVMCQLCQLHDFASFARIGDK